MPFLPDVSKITSILPVSPGDTGFLSYSGTVHPHVVVAARITRLEVPVFSKVKMQPTFSPSLTLPKGCSYSLKVRTAFPVSDATLFSLLLPFLPEQADRKVTRQNSN